MNEYCDRGVMLEKLSKPLSVAKDKNLHLYCGEFGCYKKVPEKRDMPGTEILFLF